MVDSNIVPVFKYNNNIRFIPLYDIHVGAPTFDEKAFLNTVDYIKKNDGVYWALDGDCIENIILDCVASSYDQTILPSDQAQWLVNVLKPIRQRGLYGIAGNHTLRTKKKAYYDIMQGICRELDLKYLNIGGYVQFQIGKQLYTMATQHGDSGAQNWELEVKRLRNNYPEAELFILGHDHTLMFEPKPYEAIGKDNRVYEKCVLFCRAGNYLGFADYARTRSYERKITGSLNIKFHADTHLITGYKMQYLNGELFHESMSNMGNKNQQKKEREIRV